MSDTGRPRLVFSAGDPGGVGPFVSVAAARVLRDRADVTLVGVGEQLRALLGDDARGIAVDDAGHVSQAAIDAHAPSDEGGHAQLEALDRANDMVTRGDADALVTGPVSKASITRTGVPFIGQTEHLARRVGLADDDVTMMFLGPRLSVALVTTHLAIREVPDHITVSRALRSIRHLGEALERLDAPAGARVVVAALNPHAGEDGLFGDEEPRVLVPALEQARALEPYLSGRLTLLGPRPAETAFREAAEGRVTGVVAMMHDQATIASKLLDWGNAVNVTWGLPILRTSVDHGVGYDAARTGAIDSAGMIAAAELALRLCVRA
jgi:4-hydroxythreonine-4-phosphate dehydrogenase